MSGDGPPALPRSLSAVLPAFNESGAIESTVAQVAAALAQSGVGEYDIIVVDDGSRDDTGARLERLRVSMPRLRVVHHPENRGYGAALRSGFEQAAAQAVWLLDSDGQFDPADLRRLLAAWGPTTLVAGYRERRRDPLMRRVNHSAFFGVVRMVFGPTVRDVNCAFKLFPRAVGLGLTAEGAMISTQLVLRARRAGYAVAEVSIPHYPRTTGQPTGANPRVVLRAFAELWRFRRHPETLRGLAAPET